MVAFSGGHEEAMTTAILIIGSVIFVACVVVLIALGAGYISGGKK